MAVQGSIRTPASIGVIGLPANLFYSTSIPTCILAFRAPGTKAEERRNGVLFIDDKRFTKAKNRNVLTEAVSPMW
ncbi:N-6 DNA methylase [Streptomyces mirabilis]|uniref:N-6 DNA methylase n=1 Tax=Streptomyces mirabilis TaxID=68239 RepID=UPI0036797AF9